MLKNNNVQITEPEYSKDPLYIDIKQQFDSGKMDQEQFDSLVQGAFPTPENVKLRNERIYKSMFGLDFKYTH
jgi:hypothetical protein